MKSRGYPRAEPKEVCPSGYQTNNELVWDVPGKNCMGRSTFITP
jgi:hypothetical protein